MFILPEHSSEMFMVSPIHKIVVTETERKISSDLLSKGFNSYFFRFFFSNAVSLQLQNTLSLSSNKPELILQLKRYCVSGPFSVLVFFNGQILYDQVLISGKTWTEAFQVAHLNQLHHIITCQCDNIAASENISPAISPLVAMLEASDCGRLQC